MKLSEAKSKSKKRYYHASNNKFKPGKILVTGGELGKISYLGWNSKGIYMTMSPMPHFTIAKDAYINNWIVYEVVPIGKVRHGMWDDLVTDRVKIVKVTGNARGIINNRIKGKPKEVLALLTKAIKNKNFDDIMPPLGSSVKKKSQINHHFKW